MKLLNEKEGTALLYCVLFAILGFISIILKSSLVTVLTEFVLFVYFLVVLISKKEKLINIFSIMLAIFMLYPIFNLCWGVVISLTNSNSFIISNLIICLAKIVLYLYLFYKLIFHKTNGPKALYVAITILCLICSIIAVILDVVAGFTIIGLLTNILYLLMRLLLVRYAYLYN